ESQAPAVVHLDVVVEEADEAEGHHRTDGEVPGAGETDLRADVADGVPGHDRSDDGDAPHGGRPRLGDVARRAVLADVLAELSATEVTDEEGGGDDGEPEPNATRDEQTEHVPSSPPPWHVTGRRGGGSRRRSRRPRSRVRPESNGERLARFHRVVERELPSGYLLVRLVPLPGEDDHIARLCVVERPPDGQTPVGLDDDVRVARTVGYAAQDLLDDRHRVFVARVVRGEVGPVAQTGRHLAH